MSRDYKHGDHVPSDVLAVRLKQLARAVTEGPDVVRREFTMRVPVELDRDADVVLWEASKRLQDLEARLAQAQAQLGEPVGYQAKFTTEDESRWATCHKEHHDLVLSEPEQWKGYEVRAIFATTIGKSSAKAANG